MKGSLNGAALAHARHLRESIKSDDDYGARVTEAEAERWDRAREGLRSLKSRAGAVDVLLPTHGD
jgi:hypothetical protein